MSNEKQEVKLLWIDLEMTGLDVEKEVIIEVAALATDIKLNIISPTYHSVVKQPQEFIDNMDTWNTEHHGNSGLTASIPSGKTPQLVETQLCSFVSEHFVDKCVVLSGNSIGQDRKFIHKYWPKLDEKLNYRMLDVTSWKIIFENLHGVKHQKKDTHRAVDDIFESIEELKFYLKHIDDKI